VSGADAEKFEHCMKQNAPELFEKSPDLLHHLVTIMNPKILKKSGVPIYKINQNVGEFVITFPRAYHAGFNQGFNFAEAVNFCPADWMPLGRAAIESYKLTKRHSVFSHDELICKVATSHKLTDINIINAIKKELASIIQIEKQMRWELTENVNYF
jgi:histone demethylase JARID1